MAVQWLPHENGEFERIRPHLTLLGFVIIVQGNPEGAISRKVGLIWGIPVKNALIQRIFSCRVNELSKKEEGMPDSIRDGGIRTEMLDTVERLSSDMLG